MNRLGFIFLSILRENEATSRLTSMSVRELSLAEDFGVKENTLFKKAREFEKSGYVGRGLKEGRAATFYITAAGSAYLEDLRYEEKERRMRS